MCVKNYSLINKFDRQHAPTNKFSVSNSSLIAVLQLLLLKTKCNVIFHRVNPEKKIICQNTKVLALLELKITE